ncbi:MAG: endonuclease/exonuclease/phosphatase family protein [Aggregatilineales bacterium]
MRALRFTVNKRLTFRMHSISLYQIIFALFFVYTFAVLCLWLLSHVLEDTSMMIGLYHNTMPLVFVPVILFAIMTLTDRNWFMIACLSPMLWGFGAEYLHPFFNTQPNFGDQIPITFLTYNMYGIERDLADSIDLIRDAATDIVALQELSVSAAVLMANSLEELYPYQALHPQEAMILGHGVLSRYPIIEDEVIYIQNRPSFQRVVVLYEDRYPITIFNVHSKPPILGTGQFNVRLRTSIVQDLMEKASSDPFPTVMLGDFNMTQSSDDYRRVAHNFTDLHRQVGRGLGLTFPDLSTNRTLRGVVPPFSRLDYIFYNDGMTGLRTRVWGHSGGSDHRPVWGALALKED